MLIPREIVHDLKTERADVLPPLPMAMRLVPISFYLIALATIGFATLTALQIAQAVGQLESAKARTLEATRQLETTTAARTDLDAQAKRASDFLQWVEGSVQVQPLVVAIARSISERSAITELALARDGESNRQIQLLLRFQGTDPTQIEETVEAIRNAAFRPFSPRQSQEGNRMDYEASLIRQVSGESTLPDPQPATPTEVSSEQ